jgi:hypothetical protein
MFAITAFLTTKARPMTVLLLLLLAGYAPTWAQKKANDHSPKQVEIPFTMDRNLTVITLKINDAGDFSFIFDTGTEGIVLSETVAQQLQLTGEGFTLTGRPNDPNPVQARNIQGIALAANGWRVAEQSGIALKTEDIFLPPGVAGIVSLSTFKGYLVTIDYGQSKIILRKGELSPKDRQVFAVDMQQIVATNIMVNGISVPAHLDSGGPEALTFPWEWQALLNLKGEPKKFAKAMTGSGEVELYKAQLSGSVVVGGITLMDPMITLVSGGFEAANIGYPFLREYLLTIDAAHQLARLVPLKKKR